MTNILPAREKGQRLEQSALVQQSIDKESQFFRGSNILCRQSEKVSIKFLNFPPSSAKLKNWLSYPKAQNGKKEYNQLKVWKSLVSNIPTNLFNIDQVGSSWILSANK